MATTTAKRPKHQTIAGDKSVFSRIIFGVFLFLMLAAAGIFAVLIFGRCTGEEFSATDFSKRSFYYFRIPLLKFQVTPIVRTKQKSVLVNYLHKKQLVPNGNQSWELARLQVSSGHPYEADELILTRYLQQRNSAYDLRWLKFSQDNPKLARAFWPIIWRVANEDLYVLVPELFQLAWYTPDPVELDSQMRTLIINDGARIAAGEYQLANYERAARITAFVLALAKNKTSQNGTAEYGTGDAKSTHNATTADSLKSAAEIQAQVVKQGVKLVHCKSLAEFDPNTPEPADLPDETDPTEIDSAEPVDLDPARKDPGKEDPSKADDRAENGGKAVSESAAAPTNSSDKPGSP